MTQKSWKRPHPIIWVGLGCLLVLGLLSWGVRDLLTGTISLDEQYLGNEKTRQEKEDVLGRFIPLPEYNSYEIRDFSYYKGPGRVLLKAEIFLPERQMNKYIGSQLTPLQNSNILFRARRLEGAPVRVKRLSPNLIEVTYRRE